MSDPRADLRSIQLVENSVENGASSSDDGDDEFDSIEFEPQDFDEDTYSMSVVQLIYDANLSSLKKLPKGVLMSRYFITIFLVLLTISLQIYLLYEVKHYVSARAVHDIRIAYHQFEVHMYTNDTSFEEGRRLKGGRGGRSRAKALQTSGASETYPLDFRGDPNDWDPLRFDTLDKDVKSSVCRIPMSQPFFFELILFLWSATCLQEFRNTWRLFKSLIINTATCSAMGDAFEGDFSDKVDEGILVVQNLTLTTKGMISALLVVRSLVTAYLLWLGCRWLLATTSFSDVIINVCALEFILLIKDTVYFSLMPLRFRGELQNMKMLPQDKLASADYSQLWSVSGYFILLATWVTLYMVYLQRVLPDYRWDAHQVCASWIEKRFEV
eukprot:TRINITY_DN47815_c0_g1_i1.p1 TRINITY_DN47815_c0_g1~~TRINITY_DN47815_c0_g1_i1.p1  ORF type:complete len:384 (-),score=40.19 TRINITY_DN47815_c0_g1_i1:191-1342(-)